MLRPTALIPALLCAAAVVLGFLCIFAGQNPSFMQNYDIMTLNTSRIGQNLISDARNDATNKLPSFLQGIAKNLSDGAIGEINSAIDSIAERVGVEDFYAVHMLDYCYGNYDPQAVPNITVSQNDIHKNVSACSNRTAMYNFDPTAVLQESLNRSGVGITLNDLQWPQQIEDGLNALRIATKAMFVLYCIGVALACVALLTSLIGLLSAGRLLAFANVLVTLIAFLALGIASAIVTAIMVKGENVIDQYGSEIGVSATRGNKFLALTWAATGSIFLAIVFWSLECCIGHRRRRTTTYSEKP